MSAAAAAPDSVVVVVGAAKSKQASHSVGFLGFVVGGRSCQGVIATIEMYATKQSKVLL
jgi:hypothetical protein